MVNRIKPCLVIGFLSMLVLISCSPTSQRVSGSDLSIKFIDGPVIKVSEALTFWLTNMSTACIEFPDDFGIEIYYYSKNDSWTQTSNLETYVHPMNNKLEPHGNLLDIKVVILTPGLSASQISGPTAMKVTIKGNICNDPKAIVEKEIPFTVTP